MNGSANRGQDPRVERVNNLGRSKGRETGQCQDPSPQNNSNSNGHGQGRDLLVVCFPPLGRHAKAGKQNTLCGRGRKLNSSNPLFL